MASARQVQRVQGLHIASIAMAATAAASALLAIAGWAGGIRSLTTVSRGGLPAHPALMLAVLLAAAALMVPKRAGGPLPAQLRSARGLLSGAAAVATLAALGLPLRAAPLPSSFPLDSIIVAVAVAGVAAAAWRRALWPCDVPAVVAAACGLWLLVAALYDAPVAVLGQPGSIPAGAGAFALGLATLLDDRCRLLAGLFGEGPVPRFARRLFPLTALPILVGYFAVHAIRIPAAAVRATTIVWASSTGFAVALALAAHASHRKGPDEDGRAHAILASAPDAVLATDAAGRITWSNPAASLLFERSAEELASLAAADLLVPRHRARILEELAAPRGTSRAGQVLQVEAVRRDGRPFPAELALARWRSRDEEGRVVFLRDAATRAMVEEALRAARADAEAATRAKAQFLATMSHEIRTPLNAVIGLSGLLMETDLGTTQAEYARTIRASGEHLLVVVNDILDFSRIEAGGLTVERIPFSPRAVVEEAVAMLRPRAMEKGLEITAELDPGLPAHLTGDPARTRQILINLVGNAVKFTGQGRVSVRAERSGNTWTVAVADTGIGIPADRFDRLFGMFSQVDASTTRAYGGTGLGLAISKRLANALGGDIRVASTPGVGSTFTLQLPVAGDAPAETQQPRSPAATLPPGANAAPRPAAASPPGGAPGRHERILLAEDNATNRLVATRLLQKLGRTVEVATDGLEAVAAVAAAQGERPFTLVLMDVQMPNLDGVAATARIRAAGGVQPRIVAMTADALPGDRERFLAAGMDDYVAKPVRVEELQRVLEGA